MISVEEALEKILSYASVLPAEHNDLLESLGQVTAGDIVSEIDVPPFNNAAMDGYAVKYEDIESHSSGEILNLHVTGEVAAGCFPSGEVVSGTAFRIMTGGPIPEGADTVVPFEDTDEDDYQLTGKGNKRIQIGIKKAVARGSNIRSAGEDISRGCLVLPKGKTILPADIGLMASIGYKRVPVLRRPTVGILATGNEIIEPGTGLSKGKIYNSNSYSLAAQVISAGAFPKLLGIARDEDDEISSAIERGLDSDLLITSGGVSTGDYDVVKEVLKSKGEVSFFKVRMKPGKPLAFGFFRRKDSSIVPHLGLPGNPVSSMITFQVFALPMINMMMGKKLQMNKTVIAVMENEIINRDSRRIFARVNLTRTNDRYYASLTGPQGSGILSSMAQADGLAIIREDKLKVKPGDNVEVMVLNHSLDW